MLGPPVPEMLQGAAEQLDAAAVPVSGQPPAAPAGLPWLAASDAAEPVQQLIGIMKRAVSKPSDCKCLVYHNAAGSGKRDSAICQTNPSVNMRSDRGTTPAPIIAAADSNKSCRQWVPDNNLDREVSA